MEDILKNVYPIAVLILLYVVSYFLTKIKISSKITSVISKAELEYKNAQKSGNQKMEFAIDFLYGYVPVYLKPFITRELIKMLIQKTFDEAQTYINIQLDKVADKFNKKFDECVKVETPKLKEGCTIDELVDSINTQI